MSLKNIEALDADAVIHDVVVVAFDMCSSSKILEDLTRTGSLKQFDRLLKNLRVWLVANATSSGFIPYKFTGDGWLRISAQCGRCFSGIVDGISEERGRRFRLIVDAVSA